MAKIDRVVPLLVDLIAACAAVPGLALPFLCDDWHLLQQAARPLPPVIAYGWYFRPLYEPDGVLRVRILKDPAAGRRAFVWSEGDLVRLF